ncbi:trypsin-like serine protease [Chitinispirillum alkaliphilum]|nr:trypsin-like serine protease [Chitinispirillum alkaliphilum]
MVISLVFFVNCSFAEQNEQPRPQRGSVEFGANTPPAQENRDQIERFRNVFVNIAREVVPYVVSVIPTKIDTVLFHQNPFYRQFNGEGQNQSDDGELFFDSEEYGNVAPESRERRQEGLGSGVIVSKEGYIITNYHVIAGAAEIEIRMSNDRTFSTELVGIDSLSDLAVLKITGNVPEDLPVAYLADSDSVEPGDWVVAVGNPFSLTSSVTAGIVSALGRQVGDASQYQDFIQTDAAINPGNSGGALVNIYGELVGINTLIYSKTGGFIGIGFAIPINMAKKIMMDLIYEGKVSRGWIGISIQDLNNVSREALGLNYNYTGVLISDLFRGEPAQRAGLKRGDVIVSIDGKQINNSNHLRNTIASFDPGKIITITIIRNGKEKQVTMTVSQRPEQLPSLPPSHHPENERTPPAFPQSQNADPQVQKGAGITVCNITNELRSKFNILYNVEGVMVLDVCENVRDNRSTLLTGDVIKEVRVRGYSPHLISSKREFKNFSQTLKPGDPVMIMVQREQNAFFVEFRLE